MTPNWPWTLQGQITPYVYNNCPRVSNFTPFCSMTSCFRVICHFETSAPNDPKLTLNPTRPNYPIYVLLVSTSPKFHSISLYYVPFLKYRPFWDKCTERPQIDLKPYKVELPYMYNICLRVSNFTPFCSMTSCFRVIGHFETSAPNDPRMTLNTARSKVHYICVTSVPKSQISLCFDLRPAVFKMTHNLKCSIDYHVKRWKKKKKCHKFKITNFTILLTTLVDTFPRSIHRFLGAHLVHAFRGDVHWNFYSRMVTC